MFFYMGSFLLINMEDLKMILMLLYIISPVDLMPGPVDDVIVALMGVAMMSRKSEE